MTGMITGNPPNGEKVLKRSEERQYLSCTHHIVLEMFWQLKVGRMRSAAASSSSMRLSGVGM